MFTHTILMWRDVFLPQCRTIWLRAPAGESGRAVRPLIAGRIKNAKAASNKVVFAYAKATQGTGYKDPTFKDNLVRPFQIADSSRRVSFPKF